MKILFLLIHVQEYTNSLPRELKIVANNKLYCKYGNFCKTYFVNFPFPKYLQCFEFANECSLLCLIEILQ